MLRIKKFTKEFTYFLTVFIFLGLTACSKDSSPVDSSGGGNSKVSGSVNDSDGFSKILGKGESVESNTGGIQGVTVIIAEV